MHTSDQLQFFSMFCHSIASTVIRFCCGATNDSGAAGKKYQEMPLNLLSRQRQSPPRCVDADLYRAGRAETDWDAPSASSQSPPSAENVAIMQILQTPIIPIIAATGNKASKALLCRFGITFSQYQGLNR